MLGDNLAVELGVDAVRAYIRRDVARKAGIRGAEESGKWIVVEQPWRPPRPLIPWRLPYFEDCVRKNGVMVCRLHTPWLEGGFGGGVEYAYDEQSLWRRCHGRIRGRGIPAPTFSTVTMFRMVLQRVMEGIVLLKHPDIESIAEPRPFSGSKVLDVRARNLAEVLLSLMGERGGLPESISEALNTLFPDYAVKVESAFGRVVLVAEENGLRLPPHNMPDGLVKLLAILVAAELNPSILLIDETENSLHARIIEYLVDYLNAMPIPVLAATHSPIPIDLVDPSDVIVVRKGDSGTTAARLPHPDELRRILAEEGVLLSSYVIYHETVE